MLCLVLALGGVALAYAWLGLSAQATYIRTSLWTALAPGYSPSLAVAGLITLCWVAQVLVVAGVVGCVGCVLYRRQVILPRLVLAAAVVLAVAFVLAMLVWFVRGSAGSSFVLAPALTYLAPCRWLYIPWVPSALACGACMGLSLWQ